MNDLELYELTEYWELTIKQKMTDGTFQNVLYQATIKWFSDKYFEGEIIQQQNNTSFKIQSGYASNGPFNMGAISFEVIANDGSVRSFQGNIVDELSIWGHCTLKDEKQIHGIKAGWNAFRYEKIYHEVHEKWIICPYCKTKINGPEGKGECKHFIIYTDPDCFSLDLKYPLMPKACANFEWPEKTLLKIFGNLRNILDAYENGLSEKPDIIRYFEELMEKISCDYETRDYEFSGGCPGSGSCGLIYFAKDPDAVRKKLYKTIQKLKRCFKKLEDKMNKEHLWCPYCGADYTKTKCMHYVTHTDVMNYPRLSEKLKDKKWLQENLRKTFGELYDVLDAYEHGLTKEPNRIVYLKKLLEKLSNCELKYYEHKESLVVFANDKEKIIEKLSEMEKRLFWLFRGIAYVEGIKVMGNTKGRK